MVDKISDIKRNSNNFSFTDTVASLVNNRQWKSGYDLLKNGERNDKTYFWECLSSVGEEIGDVIYDNVLNYINNVANINTCKVHALKSIATVLGIRDFAILGNIEQVPLDVLNLIDIFSINRAYLLNVRNFDSDFVRDVFENVLDEETYDVARNVLSAIPHTVSSEEDVEAVSGYFGLSGFLSDDDLSNVFINSGVSLSAYENYVEECFFKLLTSKIFQRYGDEPSLSGDLIFLNLLDNDDFSVDDSLEYMRHADPKDRNTPYSKNILWYKETNEAKLPGLYNTNYADYVYRLKKTLNVAPWFNQRLIVDKIENGFDFLDNYSGGELSVIKAEMAERAKPKYSHGSYESRRKTTRYSYYNEIEVKKYVKFVDGMFSLSTYFNADNYSEPYNPYNLANLFNPYGLDETFSDITNVSSAYGMLSNLQALNSSYSEVSGQTDLSTFIFDVYTDYSYPFKSNLGTMNSVKVVAKILKDICFAIVDIRERLKTQSQRNYMIGTKLLIEYILNEYLINALVRNYGVDPDAAYKNFGASIIEYNDTTEYYNIGPMLSDVELIGAINQPYWNSLSIDPFNGQQGGNGLPEEEVKRFYLSTLNIRNTSWRNCISDDTYYDFMSAVYDLGRSESYYSLDKGLIVTNKERFLEGAELKLDRLALSVERGMSLPEISALEQEFLVQSEEGYYSIDFSVVSAYYSAISSNLIDLLTTIEDYNSRLSACYGQQQEIALKYHGADIYYYPWYNYKNTVYPTFQTHPYMYNFIEHTNVSYPIENAFYGNANEDLIAELQSQNISVYLEEFGNIVRVWRNSNFDYSGYKSRYEASTHNVNVFSNPSRLWSVTHYDGTFYPPALTLYKKYLNEELNRKPQTPADINMYGYKLVGWERLSADMLCTTYADIEDDLENLTIDRISSMWHYYSHLNLSQTDKRHICEQLINLSAYLSDVSTDDRYDIYKYGLDFNMDSFILYKQYKKDSPSYTEKKETLGQLWIRFNNHPIGFPAFVTDPKLSTYGQFDWLSAFGNRSVNNTLCAYVFQNATPDNVASLFYDFDLASMGRYLLLAGANPNVSSAAYKNAVVFAGSISQHKTTNYLDPGSEQTFFNLLTYGREALYPSNENEFNSMSSTAHEFMGFFQNNYTAYAGYVKRYVSGGSLTAVGLNAIEYPASIVQSNNSECHNFAFNKSWKQPIVSSSDIYSLSTLANAQIVLGYSDFDMEFSLVVKSKMLDDKSIIVQDYTANQTIEGVSGYGKTDIVFEASDVGDEKTSFDRFSDYILLYDIAKARIEREEDVSNVRPLVYGLNADASWIPLYPGLSGQNLQYRMANENGRVSYNRSWHELSIAKESIELLGHTYQDLADKFVEYESTIIEDAQTGKRTNFDPNTALDTTLRVYEDFPESAFVLDAYSKSIRHDGSDSDSQTLSLSFDVGSPVAAGLSAFAIGDLSSDSNHYKVILLNVSNGKNANPILAGKFCPKTIDSPNYDEDSTYEEKYILSSHGYKLPWQVCVVGTPNPFSNDDLSYEVGYSNHLFNIAKLSTKLRFDGNINHFFIDVAMTISDPSVSFVVPTGQLRLFVYKDTLEEFDKYHYMEPFGHFPYNAAMSSWSKVPWKDVSQAFIYNGKYLSSIDGWWSAGDYIDKRDAMSSHIEALRLSGAQDYQIVPHLGWDETQNAFYSLSDSAIANKYASLSLMEKIELSSIVSFDEQYFLSTGQITFKISEEDRFNYLRSPYPPAAIDQLLYSLFKDTSSGYKANSLFSLSNTYIFQLEDPDRLAELIGKIAVPIYDAADESVIAYEEYLSDAINMDVNGVEALKDYEFLDVPPCSADRISSAESADFGSHSFPTTISEDGSLDETLSALALSGGDLHGTENRDAESGAIDYVLTSVSGKDIADYLKVYANWRTYEDSNGVDEIELFFNAQNLFNSPYHYKTKSGFYAIEFKENTYLRLKSGEDGYLYIVLQFKYYDMNRNLVGVRDLPILTYHIYNLSDDKPKFLLVKTYEIDNRDGKYTYSTTDKPTVYVLVNEKEYSFKDISNYFGWDYTMAADFPARTTMEVLSPIPLSALDLTFIYERGKLANTAEGEEDPEFVFETNPNYSHPGKFADDYGIVDCSVGKATNVDLGFTLLRGATIDEYLQDRYFPIEMISAYGVDINGNVPDFVLLNGGIKFSISSDGVGPGIYLGRETNYLSEDLLMSTFGPQSDPEHQNPDPTPDPGPPGPGPGPGPGPVEDKRWRGKLVIDLSALPGFDLSNYELVDGNLTDEEYGTGWDVSIAYNENKTNEIVILSADGLEISSNSDLRECLYFGFPYMTTVDNYEDYVSIHVDVCGMYAGGKIIYTDTMYSTSEDNSKMTIYLHNHFSYDDISLDISVDISSNWQSKQKSGYIYHNGMPQCAYDVSCSFEQYQIDNGGEN